MLSRLRRYSTSPSRFYPMESGSHHDPALNSTRYSRRVRKLLKGVSRLEIPGFFHESITGGKVAPSQKTVTESGAIRRLRKMRCLPPLSPAGRQFATDIHERTFTHGDVVGDGFSQWLADDFPHFEEVVGKSRAARVRDNVALLRRGNEKEIRALEQVSTAFERSEKWSMDETTEVPRYPTAICTTLLVNSGPTGPVATSDSDSGSYESTRMSKTSMCSARGQTYRENAVCYSVNGARSPVRPVPSDAFCYARVIESSAERENLQRDIIMPLNQLDPRCWSLDPYAWTIGNYQCLDYDSEEEDWRLEKDRRLAFWLQEISLSKLRTAST